MGRSIVSINECRRTGRIVWALAGALALALPARAAAQSPDLAASVKANFLYKFAPFVAWPTETFEGAGAPLGICIVGDDPFGAVLDRAVAGQKVGDRPIAVRRLMQIDRAASASCQIVFAGGAKGQSAAQAVQVVKGAPVLTVADGPGAEAAGAVVRFVIRDSRVRFEIDARAAAQNGLTISSKLLSLALAVRGAAEARP